MSSFEFSTRSRYRSSLEPMTAPAFSCSMKALCGPKPALTSRWRRPKPDASARGEERGGSERRGDEDRDPSALPGERRYRGGDARGGEEREVDRVPRAAVRVEVEEPARGAEEQRERDEDRRRRPAQRQERDAD